MKTLYLDCFAGISGDMFLGALTDLGICLEELSGLLNGLGLTNYSLGTEKVCKNGISGTKFTVYVDAKDYVHRHLPDITYLIGNSSLPQNVKRKSILVFENLAAAEAKIHGISPEKVHFHEVGAIDSIIDIVGTVTAVDLLGIEQIICSPLPLGSGFVTCTHGVLPLPAPAALELLSGIPAKTCDIEGETVTPTGAALVKTLASQFGPMPSMHISKIGYGAGEADRKIPNLLRAVLGEAEPADCHSGFESDFINVIEANIDDMNPEFYEHIIHRLFSEGAVDVYLTPVIMKKSRPGQILTCLAPEDKLKVMIEIILTETSSLGVRTYDCQRYKLIRETLTVNTKFGPVNVKVGRRPETGEILNIAPEWEDCKVKATEYKVPVKIVYDAAKTQFYNSL